MTTAIQAMHMDRSPEEIKHAYREFHEEIRPMQEMAARLVAAMPTPRLIMKDGQLHVDPVPWPAGVREMYDEFIRAAARRHGFEMPEPSPP